MRTTWHAVVGCRVLDVQGRSMGRVADLLAAGDGDTLRVTALLVGRAGLLSRIVERRWLPAVARRHEVPWQVVRELGPPVRLTVTAQQARDLVTEQDEL